ncbi:TolB-like translocation protein [Aquimarina algicola]|uniref:Exo-alpha-sialidase n=1 Tax=Aquimarina algicola TaxID=2589995 RepID=A0A504J369_9FLAO|nr:PD40 domain-containing protein [Aquimarina algicola]TPN82862.1 hypothetical protein FHK87_20770 [Aquimarina algicola]
MRQLATLVILSAILLSCNSKTTHNTQSIASTNHIDISDQLHYKPEMVGPYVISRSHFEGHASITPAGDEIYFAVYSNDHAYSTIAYSTKVDGEWTEPEIASFSGKYSDGSPALSPDGKRLYFSSRRPISRNNKINASNDIWYVERINTKSWGEPMRLQEGINTEYNEFSPSVDNKGNLFFCSNRPEGFGDLDVYKADFKENNYQTPVLLDSVINSKYHEGNVGVSPDGNMLFVMIQHKPGDYGYDDIHYSIKKEGKWSPVQNLGSDVNTYTYDFSPKVSPDGKTLYFSSRINRDFSSVDSTYTFESFTSYLNSPLNGLGNIYKIDLNQLNLKK